MSQEHPLQLGHRSPPRCYTRPVSQVATSSPVEGAASAALLVLGLVTGIAVFAATYGGWFYWAAPMNDRRHESMKTNMEQHATPRLSGVLTVAAVLLASSPLHWLRGRSNGLSCIKAGPATAQQGAVARRGVSGICRSDAFNLADAEE